MSKDKILRVDDLEAWRVALSSGRPILAHLNADTTWLIQLPRPPSLASQSRSRFNILIDPWLQGPQSDVASWFSTQWHVVAPCVESMGDLNRLLRQIEEGDDEEAHFVDVVAISHEFTDHCHRLTLTELPKSTPVWATEKAADLIRSWSHFETVVTTPGFSGSASGWREELATSTDLLPTWLRIGRVVTEGNSLYYHSALLIAFDTDEDASQLGGGEAIVYSPHGIKAGDLACIPRSGLKTLALLHGLHDVRIWRTAQLNLGAVNGIAAVRACGAKYWMATHDEAKRGGGLVSWFLQRTTYTLGDAVRLEETRLRGADLDSGEDEAAYHFLELGSGDVMVLEA